MPIVTGIRVLPYMGFAPGVGIRLDMDFPTCHNIYMNTHRPLSQIAADIVLDYASKGKPVHPYAAPYVEAMGHLTSITDMYYADTADSVVRYALSNLGTWRGPVARQIKAELKEILG